MSSVRTKGRKGAAQKADSNVKAAGAIASSSWLPLGRRVEVCVLGARGLSASPTSCAVRLQAVASRAFDEPRSKLEKFETRSQSNGRTGRDPEWNERFIFSDNVPRPGRALLTFKVFTHAKFKQRTDLGELSILLDEELCDGKPHEVWSALREEEDKTDVAFGSHGYLHVMILFTSSPRLHLKLVGGMNLGNAGVQDAFVTARLLHVTPKGNFELGKHGKKVSRQKIPSHDTKVSAADTFLAYVLLRFRFRIVFSSNFALLLTGRARCEGPFRSGAEGRRGGAGGDGQRHDRQGDGPVRAEVERVL